MKYTDPLLLLFTFLIATLYVSCEKTTDQEYDLVIEKALIVDGTGKDVYAAHVLVQGDSIALIDQDTTAVYSGKRVINAEGLFLTPGFIDTHAHGDPLKAPDFKNFLAMGATTICLGQDGFSPNQPDLDTWMDAVDSIKPAVNIAMFAGHNTLRMLSGIAYDTVPNEGRLRAMEELLALAMDAGCFGMTTGLEYTPGYYARSVELNRLANVVGNKRGIIMSHMRSEDDAHVLASIRELLMQGQYCPVHISHIKVVYGKGENRAMDILNLLDSARAAGNKITADIYPYTASYTGIGILFPDWAKKPHDFDAVLKGRRRELGKFLKDKVSQRNGPGATLVGSGPYKGKTLADIALALDKPFEAVLMDDIGLYGASGAYFIMDKTLQDALLKTPYINISSDGSSTMRHPRGYGTFAKIIETYVVNEKMLLLKDAVYKMTGLPAQVIGLRDRGVIIPGYKADILLFNLTEVKENATYEAPHQLAGGFKYVIVNGKVIKDGEIFAANRNGHVLRRVGDRF